MCDLKDCGNEGVNVPKIVLTVRSGGQKWIMPAITGLRVCDACKAGVTKPEDVLADGGDRIVEALLKMRQGARLVSKRLAWTTTADAHFRKLVEMRPS